MFVVLDDFLNDEIQEFLGEFRVKIGPVRKVFEPRNLLFFARGVGGREVMLGFQNPNSLRVFEPLAQSIDEDRIEAVDAFAVLFQQLGSAYGCVGHISQVPSLSV